MKPLRILIETEAGAPLNLPEIKYTFQTLLELAGYPCRFVRNGTKENIDVYYGNSANRDCKLSIQMERLDRADIRTPLKTSTVDGIPFFVFSTNPLPQEEWTRRADGMHIFRDIILTAFYFLSGWQEKFISRNWDDFHRVEDCYAVQAKTYTKPVINLYAALLQRAFASGGDPLPVWPDGKKYAVAFTHDVDYPEMVRWIECLRYLAKNKTKSSFKKVGEIVCGKESFWRFQDCMDLEKQRGFISSFFFCGLKRGSLLRYAFKAPDPFYDIEKNHFKELIRRLDQDGFEVGMHSSFLSSESEAMFLDEKARVEKVLGKPVHGNRHHYLRMNPNDTPETARMHERAGLLYDSSLAFERKAGFRRGAASPFHLYDPVSQKALNVLEVAPTLMDDHLFGYRRYNETPHWQSEVNSLIKTVKEAAGVLVIVYHPRVMNDTFYPGWGRSFRYWIEKIAEGGEYYCDTLAHISKHWLERSQKLKILSSDECF